MPPRRRPVRRLRRPLQDRLGWLLREHQRLHDPRHEPRNRLPWLAELRRWQARVERLQRLSDDLMRMDLALPEGQRIVFSAGQYLNFVLADGAKRAFSFANAPQAAGNATIELHVRRIPGGRFTGQVFDTLREGDMLDFEGPLGRFTLRDDDSQRPILFVAGPDDVPLIISGINEVKVRGARAIVIGEEDARLRANGDDLVVIPHSDPQINALLAVLPLQLLSYHMSVMRGFDPDFPRNLSKTLTVD